jgi:ApbE superfamily uncharacterized protein (UPF0280 family)
MSLRDYRRIITGKDLVSFEIEIKETNLYIRATSNLKTKALRLTHKYRNQLEGYIARHPEFATSFVPLPVQGDEPAIVKAMLEAGLKAGVGPMASVAGAIAEFVGLELLHFSPEIIIENGGDIYLKSLQKRVVGIYAGESPLSGQIGLEIEHQETPLGICTSSGTVGHSVSLGKADAVVIISPSAILADAAATAIGNRVRKESDIVPGLESAKEIPGVTGVIIIKGDKIGSWGDVRLCATVADPEDHE